MFLVLDTNHFAELVHDTGCGVRLKQRCTKQRAEVLTTVITAQEVCEGWSAFIRKQKAGSEKQLHGYAQFQHSLELLMELTLPPLMNKPPRFFRDLRKHLPQAGTQNLKIAAIDIAHDATVLTRNLDHFTKVPGLRVANWLD